MDQNALTPEILRLYYILREGNDIPKADISGIIRPTRPDDGPDADGAKTAIEIRLKGELVEAYFFEESQEVALQAFITEIKEDVHSVMTDAREYIKLVAEAATAGLLPN